LLSAGAIALSAPAYAQQADDEVSATQEAGSPEDDADDTEIIVTATRRNEALSDVPLAVSAIGGDRLENSGVADIRQLTQLSPSLLVSSSSSEAGAGTARIRGVGTVGDNPGLESSVAVFVDGVYRSRNGTALTELGPLDRVEVLRGPQGTLFGRNASAGLISVITAKPRFEQEIHAELSYGNYDMIRGEAGITGPLSSTMAFRLDGVYLKRDGFIRDVISGRDLNGRDRYLVRGQMLFQPQDGLSIRLIGDFAKRNEECCAAVYLPARDATMVNGNLTFTPSSIAGLQRALGAIINDDPYDRETAVTPGVDYRQDVKDWGLSGEVVYELGGAELTSISAYRSNDYIRGQDADFNNLDILRRNGDGSGFQEFRTFTQELRLQGEAWGGRLDWLVGGYFASEKLRLDDNLQYGADYERYANCLLFSSVLPSAVQPTPTGTCVNVPVVQGTIAFLRTLPATDPRRANIPLLSALVANPARPGFGSVAAALGQPALGLNNVGLRDSYDQKSRNFALFTHNIFEVMPNLDLTVGLRYTNERKTLDATFTDNNSLCRVVGASPLAALQTLPCVIPGVPGGNFSQDDARKSENNLSGTAVLSFKPMPELLTYASYSRGYKSGGFNLDRSALPRQITGTAAGPVLPTARLEDLIFESENVDAFEIGAKYNGRGFDLNAAAFHQVFDDFQLNTFNGLNFVVENINSCTDDLQGADADNSAATGACTGKIRGGVRSYGLELEAFFRPMTDLSLNLGGTAVSTRYRNNLVGADGRALTNALFQLPESRISNSSLYSATASLSYTPLFGTGGMRGLIYFDARYQSEFNTGSDLDQEKIQDDFVVVNGRVGLRGRDSLWGIELWAQNLLNTDYKQIAFDAPLQPGGEANTIAGVTRGFRATSNQLFGAFLGEPRTYGVTVRVRF
jgi:outer membrane receptor protein involved in Fe transport